MADDKQNCTKIGIDQSHDIVTRLRHAAVGLPQDDMNQTAADEIERLRAELEQARTGRALRDLEQELASAVEALNESRQTSELWERAARQIDL